eukprot:gb/GEZN01015088.1/.p1 GENE.gb/GEZN01015088.1/~~gb/GEZN01015088.1/.p1  ORF type:complete len:230 (-),score=14.78 gb/GEZN01015088.1/:186-875(-)
MLSLGSAMRAFSAPLRFAGQTSFGVPTYLGAASVALNAASGHRFVSARPRKKNPTPRYIPKPTMIEVPDPEGKTSVLKPIYGPFQSKPRTIYRGVVYSLKMQKTATVIIRRIRTIKYKYRGVEQGVKTKLHVHDEHEVCRIGDVVEVVSCRPRSKTKHFELFRIVREQKQLDDFGYDGGIGGRNGPRPAIAQHYINFIPPEQVHTRPAEEVQAEREAVSTPVADNTPFA